MTITKTITDFSISWTADHEQYFRAQRDFPINLNPTPEEKQAVIDRSLRRVK